MDRKSSGSTRKAARSTYGRSSLSATEIALASDSEARAPPLTTCLAMVLLLSLDLRHETEDRQIHREEDRHDDPSHDHEDRRLDEGDHPRQQKVDFLVVELRHGGEHLLEGARGLADLDHLDCQVREDARSLEGPPQLASLSDLRDDLADLARDEAVADRRGRVLQRRDERRAPSQERRQAARELRDREAAEDAAEDGELQDERVAPLGAPRGLQPPRREEAPDDQDHEEEEDVAPQERRGTDDDDRQQRQLRLEVSEELLELRDHDGHQDRDQPDRERDQDGRVDERRDDLAGQRHDRALVLDVPAQHALDLAGLLAGLQRRPVQPRKEFSLLLEGVGDRGSGVDPLPDVREDAAQDRALLPLQQQLEGVEDRQPGLQQRDQLLVEDQEVAHLDVPAAAPTAAHQRQALAADLEDMPAAALHLQARRRGVGRLDRLLGHPPVGPSDLGSELAAHRLALLHRLAPRRSGAGRLLREQDQDQGVLGAFLLGRPDDQRLVERHRHGGAVQERGLHAALLVLLQPGQSERREQQLVARPGRADGEGQDVLVAEPVGDRPSLDSLHRGGIQERVVVELEHGFQLRPQP